MWIHFLSNLIVLWFSLVTSTKPVALNLNYHVEPGDEVVITLFGYDSDGDDLTARITSLPHSGSLYQLSQVFDAHGYSPKREDIPLAVLNSGGTQVLGSENRVVYARPSDDIDPINGMYAKFRYVVHDGIEASKEGIVTISQDDVTMRSTFDDDIEDWVLVQNGDEQVIHEPTTLGILNYYIHGTEGQIQANDAGEDVALWYFKAPSKFNGDHSDIYGGELKFVLTALVGSFTPESLNLNKEFIVLDCRSCASGNGIRLVRPLDEDLPFDGTITAFSIKLHESFGWLKDSKSEIIPFAPPTQCEMVEVLANLSDVLILGDLTRRYETIALENVEFQHGNLKPIEQIAKKSCLDELA